MQIVNRQSPSGIRVACAFHPVFAIQSRKHNLPCTGFGGQQSSIPQPFRQEFEKSMDDPKDPLSRLLCMRNLERKCSRMSNRLQKKSPGHPGAYAHLARLQHNVGQAAPLLKIELCPVWTQRNNLAVPVANSQ